MAQFGAKRPIFAPTKTTPDGALPTYDYEKVVTVGRGRLRKPRNRMHGRFRRRGLPLRGRENASARRGGMALRRGLARI